MGLQNIKTLVIMQLKDKIDLSFTQTKKGIIFKIVTSLLALALVTAVFYVLFALSIRFSVFDYSTLLPDTVLNIIFTITILLAIISCTAGIVKSLYMANDNKVLFTMPVSTSSVFISKLLLYYIYELKRNFSFTFAIFIAYGLSNGAVLYYYLWLVACLFLISLVPVLIGAVLSIPCFFIYKFISAYKVVQAVVGICAFTLISYSVFKLISLIPENIDLVGQWGTISRMISNFLDDFAKLFLPFYYVCLMVVGGTLRITAHLFGGKTFLYFAITIFTCAILFVISYLLTRPLFFKMASKQFEFEKSMKKHAKSVVHNKALSSYFESIKLNLRSTGYVIIMCCELLVPPHAVFFLNKVYGAMNTSLSGLSMTHSFSMLITFALMLSFNCIYATVISKDGMARNILKTRPQNFVTTVFSRIILRVITILLSAVATFVIYKNVANVSVADAILLCVCTVALSLGHLLMSVESDVMNNQCEQYATVGTSYSNPNETKSTIFAFIFAILFAFLYYFLMDRGRIVSAIKICVLALIFFGARIYLFVTRIKLYFAEK